MTPMVTPPSTPGVPSMTQGSADWLGEHLDVVRRKIVDHAAGIAKQDNRQMIEPTDIAEAVKTFAPGLELPDRTYISRWARIFSWTPSVTTVSAVLAVVFAGIGVYALSKQKDASSLFDIAKLLAGAIVGAAGATAKSKL